MSVEAITWALRQPIKPSSAKFVLVVLANCASGDTMLAYPSAAYVSKATGQDRKTVLGNLAKLREWGLIEDTGKRAGASRQVPVWRIMCSPDLFAALETHPEIGTGTESGTGAESPRKGPVIPGEQSLKRDTETSLTDKKQRKAPPLAALPEPPEWVNPEAWAGFVEMRKKIRHPMTPRAAQLVLAELAKLRDAGADPTAILDQSVRNGWRDVFPLRVQSTGGERFGRPEPTPQHQPNAREVIDAHKAKNPASPVAAKAALDQIQRDLRR